MALWNSTCITVLILDVSVLQKPLLPFDDALNVCTKQTCAALNVSILHQCVPLKVSVQHQLVLFLDVSVLQQPVLPLDLSALTQSVFLQLSVLPSDYFKLKGRVPRDFRLQVFFMKSVSPKPLRISLGLAQGASPVSLTPATNRKMFNQKSFNYFFRHLWVIELNIEINFSIKLTLRWQQSDIVPIICHRCHWYRWGSPRICGKIWNDPNVIFSGA